MDYDIVVPTRNRPDALRMSMPLIAKQTRLPRRLIVVDASDDPAIVARVVSQQPMPDQVEVIVLRSDRANSSHQRNLGIERVLSPVTMLPDDDSLWYPDTAEAVMKVYESDTGNAIGGVSSTQTPDSPIPSTTLAYEIDSRLLLKKRLDPLRNTVEDVFFEAPYRWYTRNCPAFVNPPFWTTEQNLPRLGTLTGFRMSFRTDAVRAQAFDIHLGHKSGWCLWEDADVSLRVLSSGKSLVAAPTSRVFHHSFPSKRANGFDYGFSQIANYAYVCCKVMPHSSTMKRRLDRYLRFKLTLYRLKRDDYGRQVHRGALAAWKARHLLWEASPETIGQAFEAMCDANPVPSGMSG